MSRKGLAQLLRRGAAAIETPGDLTVTERSDVASDLCDAADMLDPHADDEDTVLVKLTFTPQDDHGCEVAVGCETEIKANVPVSAIPLPHEDEKRDALANFGFEWWQHWPCCFEVECEILPINGQRVYFDQEDANDMDGCGWNVVDAGPVPSGFANRFDTVAAAVAFARKLGEGCK